VRGSASGAAGRRTRLRRHDAVAVEDGAPRARHRLELFDPRIVGRSVLLNGQPYTVLGVLPRNFRPEPQADVFLPLQADPHSTNQGHYLFAAARLKPGVTLSSARAEMKIAGERFRRANPKWMDAAESVAVVPMKEAMVEASSRTMPTISSGSPTRPVALNDLTSRVMPGSNLVWSAIYTNSGQMLQDWDTGGGTGTRTNKYIYFRIVQLSTYSTAGWNVAGPESFFISDECNFRIATSDCF